MEVALYGLRENVIYFFAIEWVDLYRRSSTRHPGPVEPWLVTTLLTKRSAKRFSVAVRCCVTTDEGGFSDDGYDSNIPAIPLRG
uniref:Uncharacterized protein n=1 Tax=Pararge aegeria TaxID=116150 RepID=S4NQ16_9NEOP